MGSSRAMARKAAHRISLTVAIVGALTVWAVPDAAADGTAETARVAGGSRYLTAAAIAGEFGPSGAVVIANGETGKGGFDALAANYLAGQVGAPILLTAAAALPDTTAQAVRATLAGSSNPAIYVMGGPDSVSNTVSAQLNEIAAAAAGRAGTYVTRIFGPDRYATSVAAATVAGSTVGTLPLTAAAAPAKTAFLASGEVGADALAAGPWSNKLALPVLLTPSGGLPGAVKAAIARLGIQQLIVLGGKDRIPDTLVAEAKTAGVTGVKRIAGADRFATSVALSRFALAASGQGGNVQSVYLANGAGGFPDALAVGPLAARRAAPLLTVPAGPTLPTAVAKFVADAAIGMCPDGGEATTIIALGGTDRVSTAQTATAASLCRTHGAASAPPAAPPTTPVSSTFTGAGNQTVSVGTWSGAYILGFQCPSCAGVDVRDNNGRILVLTFGRPYMGSKYQNAPVAGFGPVTTMNVQTDGNWTLTVQDVSLASAATSGFGDAALRFDDPATHVALWHTGNSNFAVIGASLSGGGMFVLVNAIGPYSGVVSFPGHANIQIYADGYWGFQPY